MPIAETNTVNHSEFDHKYFLIIYLPLNSAQILPNHSLRFEALLAFLNNETMKLIFQIRLAVQ